MQRGIGEVVEGGAMTWEFDEMDRLRGELAAVHAQIEEYKAMAVTRSEQLASALKAKEDAERFEWCLPILTAQGDLGDKRALALGLTLLQGLDGREAIDAARKDAP